MLYQDPQCLVGKALGLMCQISTLSSRCTQKLHFTLFKGDQLFPLIQHSGQAPLLKLPKWNGKTNNVITAVASVLCNMFVLCDAS